MHDGMPYGRNQGQGHSREVDHQSPTGLIFLHGPELAAAKVSLFWILLQLRMMEMVVTTGAIGYTKLQSNPHHQRPTFYSADTLRVAQPTIS